jgi:hypothetical protein
VSWATSLGGLFVIIAFYTKQVALPIILGYAFFSIVLSKGRRLLQWGLILSVGLVSFILLDQITNSWLSFYTIDNYARHERNYLPSNFFQGLLKNLWPLLILSVIFFVKSLIRQVQSRSDQTKGIWLYFGLSISLVLTSYLVFTKAWTYDNGYLPAALGFALLSGLAINDVVEITQTSPPWTEHNWGPFVYLALALVQFAILYYNPVDQIPSVQDRNARDKLLDQLEVKSGEILVFHHGQINSLAGKKSYLHSVFYGDVIAGVRLPQSESDLHKYLLTQDIVENAIRDQHFEWIFTGIPLEQWYPHYLYLGDEGIRFFPATGPPAEEEFFIRRNPIVNGGQVPLTTNDFQALFNQGWGKAQDWGRSVQGNFASISVGLENSTSFEMQIEGFPVCTPEQTIDGLIVDWNGERLGERSIINCDDFQFEFVIRSEMISSGLNDLLIQIEISSMNDSELDPKEKLRVTSIEFNTIN